MTSAERTRAELARAKDDVLHPWHADEPLPWDDPSPEGTTVNVDDLFDAQRRYDTREEARQAALAAGLQHHEFRIRSRCYLAPGCKSGDLVFWIDRPIAATATPRPVS